MSTSQMQRPLINRKPEASGPVATARSWWHKLIGTPQEGLQLARALAMSTYRSPEEFAAWERAVDRVGMPGLRVTRVQHYRALYDRESA